MIVWSVVQIYINLKRPTTFDNVTKNYKYFVTVFVSITVFFLKILSIKFIKKVLDYIEYKTFFKNKQKKKFQFSILP